MFYANHLRHLLPQHPQLSLRQWQEEVNIIQLLTYVEVDMECYWTVNVILTDAEVNMNKFTVQ